MLGLLAAASHAADSNVYQKRATWPETMLATRAAFIEAQKSPQTASPVTLGPWYATAPLPAKFSDSLFPEKQVDLNARDERNRPLWRKHANWVDGAVHNLPGAGTSAVSTYLFRTIKAAAQVKMVAGFGSDDGIEVWLNGAKIHSLDVPRGPGADQDRVQLNLNAGENRLLVKIYNRTGGHGFYFSLIEDPIAIVWKQIERDFPQESGWMKRDLPNKAHLAWLASPGETSLERQMIGRIVNETGPAGRELQAQLDALTSAKATPTDVRWLTLYASASRLHDATAKLRQLNLTGLRMAVEDIGRTFGPRYPKAAEYLRRLSELEGRVEKATGNELIRVASDIEKLRGEALLANPLLDFDKLLLIRRDPKQMGLPQNWQGNCSLPREGYDNEIAVLSPIAPGGKLTTLYKPEGSKFVGDVDLHFDGDRMLFSMIGAHNRYQIWEIKTDGSGLRQVTLGQEPDIDNYDACYLPNGKIIFDSTIAFQGVPCVGGSDKVANLAVMDADGTNMRQLCFDQDHNWCPTVLPDGRVMYTRWEYSDTAHYFTRILFRMNPDGTGQMEHYGSNSYWPNSLFYARPIPNHPTKVVAIVSGHHGVPRMGELVVLDPAVGRHEADGAVQRIPGYGKKVEPIIRDELVNASWPKFLHPYPLSEHYFLVSCQPSSGANWGIYLVDSFDNMVLLHEMPGQALLEPLPIRKTPPPPVLPDRVRPEERDALVYVSDIYFGNGLRDIPRGTVKSLRLSEFHYAYPNMGGHINVGVEGPWDVRRILGTVPVAADGSASFKIPANTPIAIQPLDAEGRAVQIMRSWITAMPGETLSCVGCHESQNSGVPSKLYAGNRKPAEIKPWFGPARGFSFKREVQPVLDKYCVGCHDQKAAAANPLAIDLAAKTRNGSHGFTPSYLNLHPYVRRPGPESDDHLQVPMEFHASTSELVQMLQKGHYNVKLDAEAWERIYTWIDLNVPDHGTWSEHSRIPNNFDKRRIELRTKYANRPEDPEAIPQVKAEPVQFIKPEPLPAIKQAKVDCPNWPMTPDDAVKLQKAAGAVTHQSIDLGDGVTLNLVLIPRGEYVMGSLTGDRDEQPRARIRVEKPFWMATCEITNRQYSLFDPDHHSGYIDQHHKDHTTPGYPAYEPDQPVVRISWKQAMAYCQWLSAKTGRKFTLPTEAQWEWACRAGSDAPFWYGNLDTDFGAFANLGDISMKLLAVSGVNPQPIANPSPFEDFLPKDARFNDGAKVVNKVGQYRPNPWGLHDMHGNVAEWTLTSCRPYPYAEGDGRNDLSATADKVVRGGSWYERPKRATASFRLAYQPYQPVYNVGFRIICDVENLLASGQSAAVK